MVFLKTRPFVKRNNVENTKVSSFTSLLMCSTHFTWSYRILPFSLPTNIFSRLCILKSPESLAGRSCLGPLDVVCFSGNWRSSELDSLWFWTSDIQDLPTSCRKFLYYIYIYIYTHTFFVFSVLYMKNALKRAQLSRYSTTFSTILRFSSELSKNWGTGLLCLHPLWIYCTGQWHKAPLFPCLFSCLFSLFLQLLHHGLYLSFTQVLLFHTCTIMSPFLQNDFSFFKRLPSHSRSCGMPLLALIVPKTLTFLSSNVWANLTLLQKLSW